MRSILFFLNLLAFFALHVLFEIGELQRILGYLDWQHYAAVITGEKRIFWGFEIILGFMNNAFGSLAKYFYYFLTYINCFYLTKLQLYILKRAKFAGLFFVFNPYIYLLLAGIFKESFFFFLLIIIFHAIVKSKFMTTPLNFLSFIVLLIRPHIYALFIKLNFKSYFAQFFLLISSVLLISYLGLLDFALLTASVEEIAENRQNDLPTLFVDNFLHIHKLAYNFFIYFFYFIFANSIFIKFFGFLNFVFITLYFFKINKKNFIFFITFIIFFNFYYLLFVSNAGIAFRMMTFSTLIYMLYEYIFFKRSTLRINETHS